MKEKEEPKVETLVTEEDKTCSTDSDCGTGYWCSGGKCVAHVAPPPTIKPESELDD